MEIYNDNNRTSNTFLLCWLCFGWHNFYNNRYIMGIIQLLISCSSLYALFVFGNIFKFAFLILISIIWSIIDMIRIIFGKYRNAAKENLLWDIKEESKPAGFRVRVCAYLIDGWVISIISAILFLFGMIFFALPVDYNASHALPAFLINFLYFTITTSSKMQGTLGKKLVKIYVTTTKGERLSFFRAFLRFLCYFFSSITLGIGYLMVAFTKNKIGLHDLIVRTYVIHGKP